MQEDNQEILHLLKSLVEHKGWRIHQDLLEKWRERKQREKAELLRQDNIHAALIAQGKEDAIRETQDCLDRYLVELAGPQDNEEKPLY